MKARSQVLISWDGLRDSTESETACHKTSKNSGSAFLHHHSGTRTTVWVIKQSHSWSPWMTGASCLAYCLFHHAYNIQSSLLQSLIQFNFSHCLYQQILNTKLLKNFKNQIMCNRNIHCNSQWTQPTSLSIFTQTSSVTHFFFSALYR